MPCPLCQSAGSPEIHQDRHRQYFRCPTCDLTFVPPSQFLSAEAEKAEYDLHQNSAEDTGYRRFLSRLFEPLQQRLPPNQHGLDFGSGPGPTLSVMLEEVGHSVALYDPFYAYHPAALERSYDFITATEVVEHLHHPRQALDQVWQCLKPGGIFGIMTKLALDNAAFARWHYKADRCHVCFFSRQTFQWLADQWQADLTILGKDVILLVKAEHPSEFSNALELNLSSRVQEGAGAASYQP